MISEDSMSRKSKNKDLIETLKHQQRNACTDPEKVNSVEVSQRQMKIDGLEQQDKKSSAEEELQDALKEAKQPHPSTPPSGHSR